MIFSLGTDCTVNHGLQDYLGYNPFYDDGVRKSPFGGTWMYHPSNGIGGRRRTNYGSLGVVADVLENKFEGWNVLGKNYRGRVCSRYYPIEFTHYLKAGTEKNLNLESIPRFTHALRSGALITFTSSWRVYYGFRPANLLSDMNRFQAGLAEFKSVMDAEYPETKYSLKFFFVINRGDNAQLEYAKTLMRGVDVPYGILLNEIDGKPGRRWQQRFDCSRWKIALIETGISEADI